VIICGCLLMFVFVFFICVFSCFCGFVVDGFVVDL